MKVVPFMEILWPESFANLLKHSQDDDCDDDDEDDNEEGDEKKCTKPE